MKKLDSSTLYSKYMSTQVKEEVALDFILSPSCTMDMINYVSDSGEDCLNKASIWGRAKIVEALIKKGVDVNKVSANGYNALMHCILYCDRYSQKSVNEHLKIAQLLIDAKIDLNYVYRHSALTLACSEAQYFVIPELLKYPINLEYKDQSGRSALDYLKGRTSLEFKTQDLIKSCEKAIEAIILKNSLEDTLANSAVPTKKPKIKV